MLKGSTRTQELWVFWMNIFTNLCWEEHLLQLKFRPVILVPTQTSFQIYQILVVEEIVVHFGMVMAAGKLVVGHLMFQVN